MSTSIRINVGPVRNYQKTMLLWGEVQRFRRRIRRGFERIRFFFGGFAATYEMICENRMLLVYFTHWAQRCVAGPRRMRTWHCGAEASPSLGPQCIIYHTSHSFDDESWSPGDYMDVSFVYDLQCVAAKRGPWEHGWWILGGV